ncbi:DUF6350 family protein [Cellulomonas marina]|uniref:Uncharacterized protein n=1 Tax=Cellulomonas marina TaxID=988821 RepID=A0A1I1A0M9_9CELL|nr:DUF6350 family protein [Cellulomonas marina]GIG30302.1 hypothetical protein Cma02nite_29020 [Cellulomonas marina]SFB31504.1 hypothetical protein SAMN05421867_11426 [Cellulomonas marina]
MTGLLPRTPRPPVGEGGAPRRRRVLDAALPAALRGGSSRAPGRGRGGVPRAGSRPDPVGGAAPLVLTGAVVAAQAVLLSLLSLVLPAMAAFVATSADPTNEGVGWGRAAGVGAALWLLGHGVPATVAGAPVTLVPLGVTALAVFAGWASARRSGTPRVPAWAAGVATYVALALVVALAAGVRGGGLLTAAVGAAVVGGLGTGLGLLARPERSGLPWRVRAGLARLPGPVAVGAAAGALVAAVLVLAAVVLTVVGIVAGTATVSDVVDALRMDVVGGAVLGVAQLGWLPDLVVWNLAWLAGPGFVVGEGTRFAVGGTVTGPLPAVPLLGALPTTDLGARGTLLSAALLLAVGALAGWYLHRRLDVVRARDVLVAVGTTAAVAGVLVAGLVRAAAGGIGPGRMAVVGGSWWAVGGCVALGALVGAALLALPAEPRVRSAVRAVSARTAAAVRDRAPVAVRPSTPDEDVAPRGAAVTEPVPVVDAGPRTEAEGSERQR